MRPVCSLCDRLKYRPTSVADTVLVETDSFVATPSVGSLVPGWVLISPKDHYLSFAKLPAHLDAELEVIREVVARLLAVRYGRVVVFEHGPATPKSAVGCTVDHAHLHLVPTDCDLRVGASEVAHVDFDWTEVRSLSAVRALSSNGLDYIYVEEDSRGHVAFGGHFGSQLLRKVIARAHGYPNEYDWRAFPHVANARATVTEFSQMRFATSKLD
jgi:ATP adenylyltransferase